MAMLISGLTALMMFVLIALLAGSGRQREPTKTGENTQNIEKTTG